MNIADTTHEHSFLEDKNDLRQNDAVSLFFKTIYWQVLFASKMQNRSFQDFLGVVKYDPVVVVVVV
jgi:hypothetical protein